MRRTFNADAVWDAVSQVKEASDNFNPLPWLSNISNIALMNENGDIALFERQDTDIVCGHYFFFSRGKEALRAAKDFLQEIFTGRYNVNTIVGITPLDNKGALWMNKRLKFSSYGQIDTSVGPCEFVSLFKRDWESENNE